MANEAYGSTRLRAGDEERDEVVAELRAHHEAGRLSAEEFDERMTAALGATYRDELPPLLTDLPRIGQQQEPQPVSREPRFVSMARRGPWIPLVPVLAVLAVVGVIGALSQGCFPWPVLWIAVFLTWLHLRGRRRTPGWGHGRGRGPRWGPAGDQRWDQGWDRGGLSGVDRRGDDRSAERSDRRPEERADAAR